VGLSMAFSWRRVVLVCAGLGLAGSLAAVVAADLLPFWWWSELLQHPRPQVAGGSLVCAVVFAVIAQGWRRWPLFLIPLIAALGMVPAMFRGAEPRAGFTVARLVTSNVLSSNPDPVSAVASLLRLDADILILLEPDHSWRPHLAPLREAYPIHREILREDNFGICLYARRGAITVWQPEDVEVPGLVLAYDGVDILAVHPPPPFSAGYHDMWWTELNAIAGWAANRPNVIVAGDLNATPWSSGFTHLCSVGGLRGIGGLRTWNPTWMRGTLLASPIDHVLVGSGLGISSHAVGPAMGSDHQPVRTVITR